MSDEHETPPTGPIPDAGPDPSTLRPKPEKLNPDIDPLATCTFCRHQYHIHGDKCCQVVGEAPDGGFVTCDCAQQTFV